MVKDVEVIVFSDLDEENGMILYRVVYKNELIDNGVNFVVGFYGILGFY